MTLLVFSFAGRKHSFPQSVDSHRQHVCLRSWIDSISHDSSDCPHVNCTFLANNTSTAGHNAFIYTSGIYVDYGNCTPGRNPGVSGANILVTDGSFTGCPLPCALGTWGPGGSTATLREMQTSCGVGCETCPEGAVCDAAALPAPNYCPVGHYNPDRGSQTAGGCRECERCVSCCM